MAKIDDQAVVLAEKVKEFDVKLKAAEGRIKDAVDALKAKVADLEAAAPNNATAKILQDVIDKLDAEEVEVDAILPVTVTVDKPIETVV